MNYYNNKEFNEPYDGITYSVMVSMGFASVENILYIFKSSNPIDTGLMRMFTAVPAHATFAVIMGYFMGLARFSENRKFFYLAAGLLAAVFMHGTYDFFIYLEYYSETIYGAVAALVAGIFFSLRAIKIHRSFKKNESEEMRSVEDPLI